MKTILTILLFSFMLHGAFAQSSTGEADSLKTHGLLMPALMKYAEAMAQNPTPDISYKVASTAALLWTKQMVDTSFFFLNHALHGDSTLKALYNPDFLSLIDNPRWNMIEKGQIQKYEAKNGKIKNQAFAKALFRMIVKDQGLMYAGNLARRQYMENGGYFGNPSIFPLLAMEEKNKEENESQLLELLDRYGWPTASGVTEHAAAGAALIINHSTHELRAKYFPLLEAAFNKGEAQPLRYAKMKDRLLVEEGKEQLYGTQVRIEGGAYQLYPIQEPHLVDQRRNAIGLGPLSPYLQARFGINWEVEQSK